MTPAQTRRVEIEAVFDAALDQVTAERRDWLDARCAGDAELRREVDALLAAHAQVDGILERDVAPLAGALAGRRSGAVSIVPDRRIGPYEVIRELGRGGMGVVYLAERADGEFRRQVAIKLLRASPDAEELHRRFLAERQILASLNHPNIAQLLDGGTTEGQLPYLVMEYVDGLPITTYCDRHGLDVAARLRLFTSVCRAVHAAHQNLVIHRDLKPSNILVTQAGDVKLLDFGIAKLLNGAQAFIDVPQTRVAHRVMTPEYASPEQVRGEPLSTASDIYALGVVLYELLAGTRPYELRTGAPRELHELVCEREPVRPSARASERAARLLRGDVDAIVMMALRKEPRRRYGSAELMSEDIQRHLDGLPVTAQQGNRGYHIAKFLRRHRVAVTLGAIAAISLVGGTAGALYQASVAHRERDRADSARARVEQALHESEEMSSFLVGLFNVNQPMSGRMPSGSLEDAVARGDAQVAVFSRQPLVQARMLDEMGRVRTALGRLAEAREALERSLALRRANGASDDEIAGSLLHLSEVMRRLGDIPRAVALGREALARRRAALGPRHVRVADVLEHLSGLAVYQADVPTSEVLQREATAIRLAAPVRDVRRIGTSIDLLAGALKRSGKNAEAEQRYHEALAFYERELDPRDPALAPLLLRLADLELHDRERPDLARPLIERALRIASGVYGDDHPSLAWPLEDLAELNAIEGRYAEAESLALRGIALRRRYLGPNTTAVFATLRALSDTYIRAGRLADAERVQRELLAVAKRTQGSQKNFPEVWATASATLGEILLARGRIDEAEALFRKSYETNLRSLGGERVGVSRPIAQLGDAAAKRGDVARADSLYRRAIEIFEASGMAGHRDVRHFLRRLAALHRAHGDTALARRYAARADSLVLR